MNLAPSLAEFAKGSLLISAHDKYFRKRGCIRGPTDGANLFKKDQEKDKIESKPDKNEKRGEAEKSLKQLRREGKKQAVETSKERGTQDTISPTNQVLVNPSYLEQLVTIGAGLSPEGANQLKNLLKKNIDIFAWESSDMTGVPERIIKHSLNANLLEKPARIVRPVKYPIWISNPVLVKKADGSWQMYIDFKNINAACPKDYYPLPEIDSKIEAAMCFPLKCFLDTYKGYHQVQMVEEDEEKIAFYTNHGTYCYTKMLFDLKNAGETYQRLIDGAFQSQIGRNLEAYVDDMNNQHEAKPKKCSFGVEEGKFIGSMVTFEGIQANSSKTKDLAKMQSPRTWGDLQSLAGKLVALNSFLSRSAEKSLPFLKTLKDITKENKHDYQWTEKEENVFQELKKMILNLLALTTPLSKETMFVYLAASKEVRHQRANTADFINEMPMGNETIVPQQIQYTIDHQKESKEKWVVYTDRASNARGSREGLVLISPTKIEYIHALRLNFKSTNNQDEYEALLINTVVAHPQANGLVDRENRSLMEGIKTRLGRERKGWVDELPNVLWAHKTSLKTSNRETPYSLMFGSEAVIPAEIGMPTHRTMMIKEGNGNEEELRLNLDLLT
uniref:Reverse transcriptase domain-containing protein n=1 Tax=Tanacetum cinerariifolium TaxID=118510 RepID=A0A6L2MY09_TANCI|nr:reverse transcriptase domain-containing protein [Tanacetum cinerariifolium]